VLSLVAWLGCVGTVHAQTWEPLRSDYRNLRGINFVAEFPDLAGAPDFFGVASPTAMWQFYHQHPSNAARIDQQLDWVKRCGVNAVRVFLSFPAWLHHRANPGPNGNQFVVNFHDFVQRCHARRIYVMPVFWSDISVHSNQALLKMLQLDGFISPRLVARGSAGIASSWSRSTWSLGRRRQQSELGGSRRLAGIGSAWPGNR
jgi:hypothetical protein